MGNTNEYNIICKWTCMSKRMVTVKLEHGTHVMTADEWKQICGKQYLDCCNNRGKKQKQHNKYTLRRKYNESIREKIISKNGKGSKNYEREREFII